MTRTTTPMFTPAIRCALHLAGALAVALLFLLPRPAVAADAAFHLGDLDPRAESSGSYWFGLIDVAAHDAMHRPVPGAYIVAQWSEGEVPTSSCTTDTAGWCTLASGPISATVRSVSVLIADAHHSALVYTPNDNHDPDKGPSRTALTIKQTAATDSDDSTHLGSEAPHVGDLDAWAQVSSKDWSMVVTVAVHSAHEEPVAGAVVQGRWTDDASGRGRCTTNPFGYCSIVKTSKKAAVDVGFAVTSIDGTAIDEMADACHDPDGETDGTWIGFNLNALR